MIIDLSDKLHHIFISLIHVLIDGFELIIEMGNDITLRLLYLHGDLFKFGLVGVNKFKFRKVNISGDEQELFLGLFWLFANRLEKVRPEDLLGKHFLGFDLAVFCFNSLHHSVEVVRDNRNQNVEAHNVDQKCAGYVKENKRRTLLVQICNIFSKHLLILFSKYFDKLFIV